MSLQAELLCFISESHVSPSPKNKNKPKQKTTPQLRHTNRKETKCFPNRLPDSSKLRSLRKGKVTWHGCVMNSPRSQQQTWIPAASQPLSLPWEGSNRTDSGPAKQGVHLFNLAWQEAGSRSSYSSHGLPTRGGSASYFTAKHHALLS